MIKRRILIGIFVLMMVVFFTACQSKNKPSSSTDEKTGSMLPKATDDYYQDITSYSGIDFVHSINCSFVIVFSFSSCFL
jgi:hypothetical protein